MSTLSASLQERGEDLDARVAKSARDLDPLPPVLPPEGVVAARLREVAQQASALTTGRLDVAGVRGSGGAALVAAIARTRRVVLVTSDVDAARRLGEDVRFFLRGAPDDVDAIGPDDAAVLVFPTNETSPYADVNPDRRSAMTRMAVLAHLACARPWSVLVLPASGLSRRVVPRDVVTSHTRTVSVDTEIDRDALVLEASRRPGTCACRSWRTPVRSPFAARCSTSGPRATPRPAASSLYGDLVLSIRPFDPLEQRTTKMTQRR